jgi:hypothetical protein
MGRFLGNNVVTTIYYISDQLWDEYIYINRQKRNKEKSVIESHQENETRRIF